MAVARLTQTSRRPLLRGLFAACALLALVAGAAVLASQAALAHCNRPWQHQALDSGDGAAGGNSEAAAAAREALAEAGGQQQAVALQQDQQQPADDRQQQQQQQQQGRHLRPAEYDARLHSATLGLEAARAAAAADAPAPAAEPGVIPKILHRVYIADPNDEQRWVRRRTAVCQLLWPARHGHSCNRHRRRCCHCCCWCCCHYCCNTAAAVVQIRQPHICSALACAATIPRL